MTAKPIQSISPEQSQAGKKKKSKKERPKPKNWLHGLWLNWIKPIGLAVLVVFSIRWTLIDWNDVPSASMEPTILVGDRILVNKLAFHLKFPFTHWKIAEWGEPNRGDIVVFFGEQGDARATVHPVVNIDRERNRFTIEGKLDPKDDRDVQLEPGAMIRVFQPDGMGYSYQIDSIEQMRDGRTLITVDEPIEYDFKSPMLVLAERKRMIKRIVAVHGDTIELRNNVLFINGKEQITESVNEGKYARLDLDPLRDANGPIASTFSRENMNGVIHPVMLLHRQSSLANFGPVTIPPDHFFAMGDNRNNSRDSRDPRLGFIHRDALVGRSFGVAFSLDSIPSFGIRFDRLFRGFDQEYVEEE